MSLTAMQRRAASLLPIKSIDGPYQQKNIGFAIDKPAFPDMMRGISTYRHHDRPRPRRIYGRFLFTNCTRYESAATAHLEGRWGSRGFQLSQLGASFGG